MGNVGLIMTRSSRFVRVRHSWSLDSVQACIRFFALFDDGANQQASIAEPFSSKDGKNIVLCYFLLAIKSPVFVHRPDP